MRWPTVLALIALFAFWVLLLTWGLGNFWATGAFGG
jgi:hypothetical protein